MRICTYYTTTNMNMDMDMDKITVVQVSLLLPTYPRR